MVTWGRFLVDLRPEPREKQGTQRKGSPREGSYDALVGTGDPEFLCP